MSGDLKPYLAQIMKGFPLTKDDSAAVFNIVMLGKAEESQIGALLMGLAQRGETPEELAGAAEVMRAHAATISAPKGAIDTCGTGGDNAHSYNVSTAVAIVTAACGVPVAKHGNRAASSKCGAADVLEKLGVNLDAPLSVLQKSLDEIGICFMFAANHHKAIGHVMPARRALGIRTIFNLLGPLANPANIKRQLLGVFDEKWLEPMALTLEALGSDCAWVVHGHGGMDEISISGPTKVAELKDGLVHLFEITPEDAGLECANIKEIRGGDAAYNAAALTALLDGKKGAYRDIVLLNTAAALIVAGKCNELTIGVKMAAEAIDSKDAAKKLAKMIDYTNEENNIKA